MFDKILGVILAALIPTSSFLIHKHILSPTDAQDIGSIIFAAISGWHGKSISNTRRARKEARILGQSSAPDTGTN